MAQAREQDVVSCGRLNEEQLREARDLADLCNRLEGLDLPLDFEPVEMGSGAQAGQFLYYEHGSLVGFASLEGITDPELCGMVHPEHRRKGIGRALLAIPVILVKGLYPDLGLIRDVPAFVRHMPTHGYERQVLAAMMTKKTRTVVSSEESDSVTPPMLKPK